jgi:hypothetical protein
MFRKVTADDIGLFGKLFLKYVKILESCKQTVYSPPIYQRLSETFSWLAVSAIEKRHGEKSVRFFHRFLMVV